MRLKMVAGGRTSTTYRNIVWLSDDRRFWLTRHDDTQPATVPGIGQTVEIDCPAGTEAVDVVNYLAERGLTEAKLVSGDVHDWLFDQVWPREPRYGVTVYGMELLVVCPVVGPSGLPTTPQPTSNPFTSRQSGRLRRLQPPGTLEDFHVETDNLSRPVQEHPDGGDADLADPGGPAG